ncbi:MAG: glycosyltransferase, partial [Actinomycetota bacterium]
MISVMATAAYLLLLLIKAASAWAYLRRHPAPGPASRASEVTVLQPILSGDPGLAHALEDNLRELPEAAFLWLVDEDDDVAQAVAHGLADRCATQTVRVLTLPAAPEGVNPKLFKLEAAWRLAATPVCVVLDDDTRLPRRSLDALVAALDDAEVTTGLPYYRHADDLPSRLLAQFVNDNAALT